MVSSENTEAVLEHLGVLGVDKVGEVTAIVEDEVELLAILEGVQLLLRHQLYSSSVSPFQAKTGTPAAAIAAAAWSWVLKMLHDDQVTSAPRDGEGLG